VREVDFALIFELHALQLELAGLDAEHLGLLLGQILLILDGALDRPELLALCAERKVREHSGDNGSWGEDDGGHGGDLGREDGRHGRSARRVGWRKDSQRLIARTSWRPGAHGEGPWR
jgi:hypothetical protein